MAAMNDSSGGPRRPRSNSAQRAQWARRFFESGISPHDFARQHGLGLSTLQRWLKENPDTPVPLGFAQVTLPSAPQPGHRDWAAEVVRADGSVLRLAHGVAPALLRQLLRAC
jgi:hypothetical protein